MSNGIVIIGSGFAARQLVKNCGVVINSGLSASSLDEPASLEWRGM
nr:hypothetical protein [Escherichia coli]